MKQYTYDYPRPAVTADCVVFCFDGHKLKVLLIERKHDPCKGRWAFPGGFMEMEETAEECAVRELCEETSLQITGIRQIGAFTTVDRDPRGRVITIAFYALAHDTGVCGGDDAAKAQWWPVDEVPPLAFDHDCILRQALQRLRRDIHFEPVGFNLLGERFTMSELQRLYESILGIRFDRRNFYKKMIQTGILHEDDVPAETHTAFFGSRHEMKRMDIDALFNGNAPKKKMAVEETADLPHTGRRGKLFRFDKQSYDRLREEGGFRLEF